VINEEIVDLITEGKKLHQVGKFVEAEIKYEEGLAIDRENLQLLMLRSDVRLCMKKYQGAASDCTKALDKVITDDEQLTILLYRRGAAWFELGLFEQSADDLNVVLALNPNDTPCTQLLDKVTRAMQSTTSRSDVQVFVFSYPRLFF